MNDFKRQQLISSFELIKKTAMERAEMINDGDRNISCMSLLFSAFVELFIDFYPEERRLIKFDEFIDIGKEMIEESIRNEKK